MRIIILITLFFCQLSLTAQDKIFFRDGKIMNGFLVSIAKETVFFRKTDTSAVMRLPKKDIVLIEDIKGTRYLIAADEKKESGNIGGAKYLNSLGIQPVDILTGRGTIVYERLTEDGNIGFVVPLSITFNPFGSLYTAPRDSNGVSIPQSTSISFITGADVNFYFGNRPGSRFYIGPRLRYGTDVMLDEIEALSVQTQAGWRFGRAEQRISQHLAAGFGFVHVLDFRQNLGIVPGHSYSWFSFTYRLSWKW